MRNWNIICLGYCFMTLQLEKIDGLGAWPFVLVLLFSFI